MPNAKRRVLYTALALSCVSALLSSGTVGARARVALSPGQEVYMVVVTNRIPVAPGWEEKFEERFRQRAHLVDESPGFVRNEVHRPRPMKLDHATGEWSPAPDKAAFYEVKTWWRSFDDFVAWTKSPSFAEAHSNRPPKEMFAGPNALEIHEVFLSTETSPSV